MAERENKVQRKEKYEGNMMSVTQTEKQNGREKREKMWKK